MDLVMNISKNPKQNDQILVGVQTGKKWKQLFLVEKNTKQAM
jgi:hypothetical protein